MSDLDFDKFVEREVEEAKEAKEFDPSKEISDFQDYIESLYSAIEGYLDDYVKSGNIVLGRSNHSIYEERLGNYSIKTLDIKIGFNEVKLKPIGTMLIGAKGRVDIIGNRTLRRLVLVDKKLTQPTLPKVTTKVVGNSIKGSISIGEAQSSVPEWTWKFASNPPRIRYQELNSDSFKNALMEVIGD